MDEVRRTIETVARDSYGRLLAYLSARLRDVAAAEDAIGDAFLTALTTWPRDGLPAKPEAWLLTAARHRLIDRARKEARWRPLAELTSDLSAAPPGAEDSDEPFPDERLKLMFVCAHPAIDPQLHTPLMLQTVLGLNAAEIGRAFLIAPATMGQRLVRAKSKIRDAGISFEVPEGRELRERLEAVLEAVYAAYSHGWDDATGSAPQARDLAEESIWLAHVLVQLLSDEPEARGLLALILHCESRRGARHSPDGRYVPLSDQDPSLWSQRLMQEAESHLAAAAVHARPGRFQLEAAIQSVHADRARTGRTDWQAIVAFYEALERIAPTVGARVGAAAALAELRGPAEALERLETVDAATVAAYQPYWAVRAHVLERLGRRSEARECFDRALGLTEDGPVRRYLLERRA